ncbi:hypothetical protein [Geomicrobium sp. JCM 19038]|uniref:hypothetical protein n=1 Tax=Geomicrobium sp. JCM 19038 TaxID=1460635 RepID=UPI00045F11BF|nr:hypothetical protein [Geomicrobium sp. JCM 19038]GAK09176.1 hypothetical protein JCM19038_3000 [Geomicrobium sp. JCM 19038]
MNTLKGPFRLIFKEMKPTFLINAGITIALMGLFVFLSFYADGNENIGVLFGPFYAIFLFFPFFLMKGYKCILSLGGTRKQFMISTYLSVTIYTILGVLTLNGFYYLSPYVLNQGYIFHMGDLVNESNPFLYLWVDALWLFILFGIGVLAQTVYFNLGTVRTLSVGAVLLIASLATFFFADLGPLFEFFITEQLAFVHILAGISVLFVLLSYLFMKNGPLEKGDRYLFSRGWKEPKPE